MKSILIPVTALLLSSGLSSNTMADVTYMAGVSYAFNGQFGLTLKALSDDNKSRVVGALGATYYPLAPKPFGIDAGVGYTYDDAAVTVSWDFLQEAAQISAGYADIDEDKKSPYTPPPAGGGGEGGGADRVVGDQIPAPQQPSDPGSRPRPAARGRRPQGSAGGRGAGPADLQRQQHAARPDRGQGQRRERSNDLED